MKNLLLSGILLCLALVAYSNPSFSRLAEVNKEWLLQKDVQTLNYPEYKMLTDREWIRIHLSLVEQTLRSRSTMYLSEQQKVNRLKALDYLHQYWQSGAFPVNDLYTYRTPIFIDRYDNFCAVGYLVKATGFESVSRKISKETNLAYVKDMKYPELFAWAKEFGFRIDELAWIQPTYSPQTTMTKTVGGGVDGEVVKLFTDVAADRIYVGGSFINVDGSILANNIAYVTENSGVYTWHDMNGGVNGTVNAIAKYDNKIFVAGSFSTAGGNAVNNVAYWDGTRWYAAGCIDGTVNDLVVYDGNLYAAGDFDVCSAVQEVNFAKWTGTLWQQQAGLIGKVNTMHVSGADLFLGGKFTHSNGAENIIKWDALNGFAAFSNNLKSEVMDLETYKNVVYVGCKANTANDSTIFARQDGNSWLSLYRVNRYNMTGNYWEQSINSLCTLADTFIAVGNFALLSTMEPVIYAMNIPDPYSFNGGGMVFLVDSPVNNMVAFRNEFIFGGRFKFGDYHMTKPTALNGIGRVRSKKEYSNVSAVKTITNLMKIVPSPATNELIIIMNQPSTVIEKMTVTDIQGRTTDVLQQGIEKIDVSHFAPGVYILQVFTGEAVYQQRFVKR